MTTTRTKTVAPIDFQDRDIAAKVEALSVADRDSLPFGVIRTDAKGVVVFYSQTERTQSGYKSRPALGLNFFLDMAPCTNAAGFRGRIEAARARGMVDIEFGWIGDFSDRERELTVRVQNAADGGLWILINRAVHAYAWSIGQSQGLETNLPEPT
jgi:photoactive yellow protein